MRPCRQSAAGSGSEALSCGCTLYQQIRIDEELRILRNAVPKKDYSVVDPESGVQMGKELKTKSEEGTDRSQSDCKFLFTRPHTTSCDNGFKLTMVHSTSN